MNGSSSNEAAAEADQVPLHQTKRKGRKRKEEDPDERKKMKNKRDRDRRAKEKVELQRLKDVEAQFKQMQGEYTKLKRENEELKSMPLNLENQEARTNQLSSGWQLTKIEELKRLQNVESQWTQQCTEFKQMEEYVKTLRNTSESLANDNELLKSRVPLLENEMEELRSDLHQKAEELKKLKTVESQARQQSTQFWKLQEDFMMLRNSNDSLVKENEFLNSRVPLLENEIGQLKKESHFMSMSFEELESFLLASPTHGEEDAANNVHITQGPMSSQGGRMYTDELVQDFTKKLDAKDKSQVHFSNFRGLMEEVEKSGTVTLPPSLALIDMNIKKRYGEIAAESILSSCAAMPSRILFCAAIKEMDELQLESIDQEKMLLWRDAINSALNINFKVDFAIQHLKKIGRAYFGLKARNDQELRIIEEKISTLQIELSDWEEKRAKKLEEHNSEVRKECVCDADYFQGKSLRWRLVLYSVM